MPASHHRHGHRHGRSQEDSLKPSPEYAWEWFWSCCNCGGHAAMSAYIVVACPGCQHVRCDYCPLESVKIRVRTGQPFIWTPTTTSSAPGALHRESSLIGLGPIQTERQNSPDTSLGAFTTPSVAATPEPDQSSPSSAIFSVGEVEPTDSATEFDSEDTESDDSRSHGGGRNEVVHLLDCRLLSVLSGELDLAARLIPKIHDRLSNEELLGSIGDSEFQHQNGVNNVGANGSKIKQQASGSSPSAPNKRESSSDSSPRKHGRVSKDSSSRGGGGNSNKRSRRGHDESSGDSPGERGDGDPAENPNGNSGESPKDDGVDDRSWRLNKRRGDPSGDPGDDPHVTPSPGTSFYFACHFYKFDSRKFGPWTDDKYEKCPCSHITELRHIRYHFTKAHTQPSSSPFCRRCFRSFQKLDDLYGHYQATVPCSPTAPPSNLNDGIDEDQWKEIDRVLSKKGKKHVDDISRWNEIWEILFPGVEKPPHPWIEPPGYIARHTYNIENLLSKFERRIREDETLQKEDQQIQKRYLHHFQQTLEEDKTMCRSIQTRYSGKDGVEGAELAAFGKVQASTSSRVAPTGRNDPPLPFQTPRLDEWSLLSNPLVEDFRGEHGAIPMGPWCTAGSPGFTMSVPNTGFIEVTQEPLELPVPDSILGDQSWPPSGSLALPETQAEQNTAFDRDRAPDNFDGAYLMGDELMAIADQLRIENEMREATAPWRDKNSGNRFLRQP